MLPNQSVVLPSRDNSKVADVEELKGKYDTSARIQTGSVYNMKTTNKTNVHTNNLSQSSTGQNDRAEERHPEKLLRPIAPKPITIVCVPDISSVRENEIEIPGKHDVIMKNPDENSSVKSASAGPIIKCEKDNEEISILSLETSMLKKTSATGRSPPKIAKKKPKQIRDLEKTLNCLLSDNEQVKDEKAFAFAQSYFLKVTETLHGRDDATYGEFMKTMNDFGVTIFDATELYKRVTKIFEKYPNLAEEFLAFLLPEQAMQCGKFMEYIMITKMSSFCRKLELYYSKQPSQLRKIYSSLATLASNNKATLDDLRNTILPLLRNNSLLVNMFLELMPTEAPHASSLTDYESMDFSSVDIQNPKSEDWFETVEVPPPVEDNMYGGEDCICPCHSPSEGKSRRQSTHCISCGTKFIQGRVYIHSGSMLRPARVSFKEMRNKAIERLSVKNLKTRRKIDKNQAPPSGNKKNSSSKGEASSSVPGSTNKLSPSKTKKNAKGKSLNENQKKSSKPLTSKASHTQKLGSDKKISKPPRKRIKLLTSNSESSTSPSSSRKSHFIPHKKGITQNGKVACKEEGKMLGKGGSQFSIDQTERTLRTARLAARNLILSNDSSQKSNRRQSANIFKGESTKDLASEFIKKKHEELFTKKTNTLSTSVRVLLKKDEIVLKNPSECKNIVCVKESSLMENACEDVLQVHCEKNENESSKMISSDEILKLSAPFSDDFQLKKEIISNIIINTPKPKSNLKEDILSLVLEKENENVEEKQNAEDGFSEYIKPVLYSRNTGGVNELSSSCPQTSHDDCHSDQLSNIFKVGKVTEICSQHSRIISQKDEGSIENEIIELSKGIENNSSKNEKNIHDSEDFPCSSSSSSEVEDNVRMEIDESCEDIEEGLISLRSDKNIGTSHEENHCNDVTRAPGIGELVCPPWTRDEDKVILRTFQSVNNSEHVFQKICHELPSRTAEEVRSRFQTLMTFLEKMTDD